LITGYKSGLINVTLQLR